MRPIVKAWVLTASESEQFFNCCNPQALFPKCSSVIANCWSLPIAGGSSGWIPPENRLDLNDALAKIQSIAAPDLEKRNYMAYCTAYINQLAQAQPDRQVIEKVLSAAAVIDNDDWTPVICHHDLVAENIIITESGPILLDWEYAALGHPALDAVRLFKNDLCFVGKSYDSEIIQQLAILQQGMDDLWSLVQG